MDVNWRVTGRAWDVNGNGEEDGWGSKWVMRVGESGMAGGWEGRVE